MIFFKNLGFSTGARGERAAAKYLKQHGYRIIARNLRSRMGEIDIVAQASDRRTIVIVEVKTRAIEDAGVAGILPEEHVNRQKQRKLAALASQLVNRYRLEDRPIRFDVIGVDLVARGTPVIRHYEGAFESFF